MKSVERAVTPVWFENDFAIERLGFGVFLLLEKVERGGVKKSGPEFVEENPDEEGEDAEDEAVLVDDVVKRS